MSTEHDIAKQIEALLEPLTSAQREDVMSYVEGRYCSHCWLVLPDDGDCECWNRYNGGRGGSYGRAR